MDAAVLMGEEVTTAVVVAGHSPDQCEFSRRQTYRAAMAGSCLDEPYRSARTTPEHLSNIGVNTPGRM